MALTRRRHTHNKTRKHAKPSGSYIYLKGRGGLNDNLVQLAACTKYAMKHHRSIIVEFTTYTAADIDTVFDFSKYPVPIYTNFKEKARELKNHPLEPACIDSLQGMPKYATLQSDGFHDSKGHILRFDLDRSYPSDTVLVYASGGGGQRRRRREHIGACSPETSRIRGISKEADRKWNPRRIYLHTFTRHRQKTQN